MTVSRTEGDPKGAFGSDHAWIGRYEILNRIGIGGMAEVFRARATGPGGHQRILIIKRILPHFAEHPDFVRAFVDEAKLSNEGPEDDDHPADILRGYLAAEVVALFERALEKYRRIEAVAAP